MRIKNIAAAFISVFVMASAAAVEAAEVKGYTFSNGTLSVSGITSITSSDVKTAVENDLTAIKKVEIGSKVMTIGRSAFEGCSELESVTGTSGIYTISDRAFHSCAKLKNITLPTYLSSLGTSAFYGCSSIEEVTLPSRITFLNAGIFDGCTSLKKVTINGKLTIIQSTCFRNCTSLEEFELPSTLRTLGDSAFWGCTGLKSIKLPDTLTTIGNNVFKNCSSMEEAVMCENVYNKLPTASDKLAFPSTLTRAFVTASENGNGISAMPIPIIYLFIEDGIEVDENEVICFKYTKEDENIIKITEGDSTFLAELRGDADLNKKIDKTDAALTLKYLSGTFKKDRLFCTTMVDINANGKVDISDPVKILKKA